MFGFTLRSLVLWVVVRLALTPFLLLAQSAPGAPAPSGNPMNVEPVTAFFIATLVAALLLLDIRAMRERVFLANLGVPRIAPAGYAFTLAVALEALAGAWLA
jgi:hypothetical protein